MLSGIHRADKVNTENKQDYYLFVCKNCMPREMKQIFVVRAWYYENDLTFYLATETLTYFGSFFGQLSSIQKIFPVKTFFIYLIACSEKKIWLYFIQIPSFLIFCVTNIANMMQLLQNIVLSDLQTNQNLERSYSS